MLIYFNYYTIMNLLFKHLFQSSASILRNNLHTTGPELAWAKQNLPKTFISNNKKIYPPQEIGEEPRPAVSIKIWSLCYTDSLIYSQYLSILLFNNVI